MMGNIVFENMYIAVQRPIYSKNLLKIRTDFCNDITCLKNISRLEQHTCIASCWENCLSLQ